MLHSKLKGGALLYAVLISFIITLFVFSLILIFSYNRQHIDVLVKRQQLIDNVHSGIRYALQNPDLLEYDTKNKVTLYDEPESSVILEKKPWGAYHIIYSTAQWKNHHDKRAVMAGEDIIASEPLALYLSNRNNHLSVCGNTEIRGICYLPQASVKRAHIEGRHFTGDKPVKGTIKKSSTELPEIEEKWLQIMQKKIFNPLHASDSMINYNNILKDTFSLHHSFYKPTLKIYTSRPVSLNNRKITGNIQLVSDKSITISKDAHLSNIIIIGRSIHIKNNFCGNIQAYAFDSVYLEENCMLEYPSFVGIITNRRASVKIMEGSVVNGGVVLYNQNPSAAKKSQILLKNNAQITGQVYTNGYMRHNGTIHGSVYAYKFFLETRMGKYENHLLDAIIDFENLPQEFTGTDILDNNNPESIIQWVN